MVHLPLLISLVEVTCRGWRGPLGQQIEEVYAIKNRRGGGNKSSNRSTEGPGKWGMRTFPGCFRSWDISPMYNWAQETEPAFSVKKWHLLNVTGRAWLLLDPQGRVSGLPRGGWGSCPQRFCVPLQATWFGHCRRWGQAGPTNAFCSWTTQ